MVVIDASLVVAALVDHGMHGRWAESVIASNQVAAPHLMPAEVANVLRRTMIRGHLSADVAALAHAELLRLPVTLLSYDPVAERVWQLRANINPYDAWYIAAAEALGAPLATLDARLVRASGSRCEFLTPQGT
ncbi:MAG: VapC toxin family PIN domain ribonuclease [Chloroflexi bacterium HGW-Chloroflexi-9]|nr:MAG: VapC toxin family PIN domain ribonuclease [Chloroflexi bacterium HGW-Chloroflexi-9]